MDPFSSVASDTMSSFTSSHLTARASSMAQHAMSAHAGSAVSGQPAGFMPRITEQEQEAANNMLLFSKASTDAFLATIHHLRTENDSLRKDNMSLKFINETLTEEARRFKSILQQHVESQQQQQHGFVPQPDQTYQYLTGHCTH